MLSEAQISKVIGELERYYDANSVAFLKRIYAGGMTKYEKRLKQYGFSGMGSVLDAGCGFGQWSLALAGLNAKVSSIDAAPQRLLFLDHLLKRHGIGNIDARFGYLEKLPYEDRMFDGVLCYGVILVTRWRESLKQMARVIKPGGLFYANANGIGWYKHIWYTPHNKVENYDPRAHAAKVLYNTWVYESGGNPEPGLDVLIEPKELTAAMKEAGFVDIQCGPEGTLGDTSVGPGPFFPATYHGDTGVYEVLARRG
jgi:ubiquinone/menaquinone biosynthesis C-methylase UbiE